MSRDDAVAIVGMAGRFPGADDVEAYWRNLRAGRETISRFTYDEVVAAGVDPGLARDPRYVPARGVLRGGDRFDRAFFGYSPAEAAMIDPQQRVFLEVSSCALDDAGIDPERFPGWIGVFAGCDRVNPAAVAGFDEDVNELLLGAEKDFLATRVAYKMRLRGPAITVQTACSTSLVAVHLACQSLIGHECDVALAGGVALWLPQTVGYLHQEGGVTSADGRCRPFDERAGGTLHSAGVGVVVLRRLAEALSAGDRIVAVIRASAINNDGGEKVGYYAPSVVGQRDVVRLALALADVEPDDIGYVEAHGTATRVGDPVEVAALTAAYREATDRTGYCLLGAVKSNIGHTSSAAGVAGLMKVALSLERRELVPTMHFRRPNPELQLETTPFRVATRHEPWPGNGTAAGPLLAGVSAFGIGGTNAHAVLESPPARKPVPAANRPRVFCLSAATGQALDRLRGDLAGRLSRSPVPAPDDVAWTLAGRRSYPHRRAWVAADIGQALDALRAERPPVPATGRPRVAFLFPGQGTLRPGAGRGAYEALPEFARIFDEAREVARRRFGLDLGTLLAPAPRADPHGQRDIVYQQLALFALGYALAGQLRALGVEPAAMLGNSIGEYVAAAVAGVWSLPDALAIVGRRAEAMRRLAPGRMLAVALEPDEVVSLVAAEPDLSLAVSGPGHAVLSGAADLVERVFADLSGGGTQCWMVEGAPAGHSPIMRPAAGALRAAIAEAPSKSPRVPFVSNLTGTWADPERVREPGYWADHLCGTVRLADGLGTLLAGQAAIFVELGPGETMSGALHRHPTRDPRAPTIATLGRTPDNEQVQVLTSVARLWEHGVPVRVESLLADSQPVRCALPPHPFDPTPAAPPARRPPHGRRNRPPTSPETAVPAEIAIPAEAAAKAGDVVTSGNVAKAGEAGRDRVGRATPLAAGDGRATGSTQAREEIAHELAAIWCRTLGVPDAGPGDDFFALGGDSLMAVRMMARVRDRLGKAIPISDFAERPTFAELLELAGRIQRPEPDSHQNLLVLRGTGGRVPLFLAAPATGSALCYRGLVELLGEDQPCYGLESAGLHDGTPPPRRLEQIAEAHLELVRRVRPHGPYVVGGWSFGALAAHEMARRLMVAGEPVAALVGIDGSVLDTRGRPLATMPSILRSALSHELRVRRRTRRGRGGSADRPPRDPGDQMARTVADLHGPVNSVGVFVANLRAMLRYRPAPVACPAVVFTTRHDPAERARLRRLVAPLYEGATEVRTAPGSHWTVLEPPNVEPLAGDLSRLLAGLDADDASSTWR